MRRVAEQCKKCGVVRPLPCWFTGMEQAELDLSRGKFCELGK
jgi:hypothetical protein